MDALGIGVFRDVSVVRQCLFIGTNLLKPYFMIVSYSYECLFNCAKVFHVKPKRDILSPKCLVC